MSLDLTIQNRQRTRAVDVRRLRQIVAFLLGELLEIKKAELGIALVAAPEMTHVNKTFLQHEGSTDVITFDHREPEAFGADSETSIHGEIFICVDEAILQARQFRSTWQSEVVRYVVHGVLHLLGYDDHRALDRRKMKQVENRLLRVLAETFSFQRLSLRR